MAKLTKIQRAELYNKYNGHCAYCGCELPEKGWHADHIIPIIRDWNYVVNSNNKRTQTFNGNSMRPELDCIENMHPSCQSCNLFKGAMSVDTFRSEISKQVDRARKTSVNFRFAEKYKLIELTQNPVVFYFEQYQNA